ncbi:type I methionyl aminopeptidase [Gracilinema caldarium]|uniref:type I methionyl aminopeptidase n=1 Tax=Gracilinema caldarium TaxID=215591 RepID=UPI0026F0B974|nr:type I methionyl aminopeptidase [Gracilinema caldarium]
MIRLKNHEQIAGIRESCKMLSAMFKELTPLVVPGVETRDLDQWVQNWIKKAGGKPAFLNYGDDDNPFPAALCVSINEEVIHGIPSKRKVAYGDLVSLDCGINLGGHFSDMAVTVEVGQVSEEAKKLNRVTRECLDKAIEQAIYGNRILQIARAVYNHATSHGYGVVHQYCGHGVGFSPHEDPQVPNNPRGPNPRMMEGLVIAIEPMINLGTAEVEVLDDGWTVVTADRKISCHWEHTVAIFQDHTEILTL